MSHKNLRGAITISRPRGRSAETIDICVIDELSGVEFVSVRISPANFAEALVGLARVECEFDLRPDLVGTVYEHKEELVPLPHDHYYGTSRDKREQVAAEAFAPFEVDGWRGRVDDLFNPHRRGLNGAKVTFVRYVPRESSGKRSEGER